MANTAKTRGKKTAGANLDLAEMATILQHPAIRVFSKDPDQQYHDAQQIVDYFTVNANLDDPAVFAVVNLFATVIEQYEQAHGLTVDVSHRSGVDLLRGLMRDHGLTQSQLPELGSQAHVSKIPERKHHALQ